MERQRIGEIASLVSVEGAEWPVMGDPEQVDSEHDDSQQRYGPQRTRHCPRRAAPDVGAPRVKKLR